MGYAILPRMPPIDPRALVEGLIILILSVAVHEFAHAWVADKLGDRLPRHEGRVTLNPLAHAHPIGTLLFPAIGIISGIGALGWGRPVNVNPPSFTRKLRMRTSHMLVAAAGPITNLLFGLLIALILFGLFRGGVLEVNPEGLYGAMQRAIFINFILMMFNLIPAPPLDGGAVLAGILPERWLPAYNRLAPYGIFVLFAFLLIKQLGILILMPATFLHAGVASVLDLPLVR